MSKDLSASIQKLQEKSSRLNEITDKANQTIQMVEKFLRTCSVGIEAYVKVTDEDGVNGSGYSTFLEYKKINTNYRIVVVHINDDSSRETTKLWSECGRDLKLQTIQKLPVLIDEITDKLNAKLKEAEIATESVYSALTKLTGKEG